MDKHKNARIFKLPAEHGAVATLAFSSLLSCTIETPQPCLIASLCALWLIAATWHRARLSIILSIISGTALSIFLSDSLYLLAFGLCAFGHFTLRSRAWGSYSRLVRESGGMAGVTVFPLAIQAISSGSATPALNIAAFLLGATFAACFIVHYASGKLDLASRTTGLISLLAFSWAGVENLNLMLLLGLPFLLELSIGKRRLSLLSFKRLGLIQAFALCWVTALLLVNY